MSGWDKSPFQKCYSFHPVQTRAITRPTPDFKASRQAQTDAQHVIPLTRQGFEDGSISYVPVLPSDLPVVTTRASAETSLQR